MPLWKFQPSYMLRSEYRICSRNFRPPRILRALVFKEWFCIYFCSAYFTHHRIVHLCLISWRFAGILNSYALLFLIGVVVLAPQQEVASRAHRSTINWIFTMFSLIIDYWIDNGIYVYSAFIMIIIDKSRLYYKITIKYWQNVPYSQLY